MNFISKLRSLFPLVWILAKAWFLQWLRAAYFALLFFFFSITLLLLLDLSLCYLWVPLSFNVIGLSKGMGWGESLRDSCPNDDLCTFCGFLGPSPLSQRLLRWMVHSMADLLPFSSPIPGFLPNSFLWVQFPWHRKPLCPPLVPWDIHTPLSYKTLMVLAALLLLFLLALCCRGSSYFPLKILCLHNFEQTP